MVDTNILIYAADRRSPFHETCYHRLEQWRNQRSPWYITWSIVYEFLRVVTHPRVLRQPWALPDAWRFLDAVLAAPSAGVLVATEQHTATLRELVRDLPHLAGNVVHDGHTAVLMREHGIERIVTRDTDFHKFPFVRVIDPVTAA